MPPSSNRRTIPRRPLPVSAPRPARRAPHAVALLSAALVVGGARGQAPLVEISGGADESRQNYQWKVTNRHGSPIVFIQFPHFHADTFSVPNRWKQECTNLIGAGKPTHLSGVCTAKVVSPADGIAPGRAAEFGMRLALLGGDRPSPGRVTVRFADGTETIVEGVELPMATSILEKMVAPIGLALIFGIIVLFEVRRRRRARTAATPKPSHNAAAQG